MIEEIRQKRYLETDEIIKEAYKEYAEMFDSRPTQAQIASICGISRKTVLEHLKGNPISTYSERANTLKMRIEKEWQKEYSPSYKRIVLGYLLKGEKTAISVQNLRRHGPLNKIPASTLSNHLWSLVEEGILERAKKWDPFTSKSVWHYWKREKAIDAKAEEKKERVTQKGPKVSLGHQTLEIMAFLPEKEEDAISPYAFHEAHNEFLYDSVGSSLSRLFQAGKVERTEDRPYRYWCDLLLFRKHNDVISSSVESTEEDVEARIATLEADIKRIQGQYRELAKRFDLKKRDSQLRKLEAMRDVEQAKYDDLEKQFKKWNDEEVKMRKDVLR